MVHSAVEVDEIMRSRYDYICNCISHYRLMQPAANTLAVGRGKTIALPTAMIKLKTNEAQS